VTSGSCNVLPGELLTETVSMEYSLLIVPGRQKTDRYSAYCTVHPYGGDAGRIKKRQVSTYVQHSVRAVPICKVPLAARVCALQRAATAVRRMCRASRLLLARLQ
jgi:hypothetical protein